VSRSGATLAAARARGFDRTGAWSLSWSIAPPVIAGASSLKGLRLLRTPTDSEQRRALAAGALSAFCSTLLSARLLARRQRRGVALAPYALYRWLLAAVVLERARRGR
jgi:undecaprenyl-diphosphatase